MQREDWGPVEAGVVRRGRLGAAGSRPEPDAGPQLSVPVRTWRIVQARLMTIRGRIVEAQVDLLAPEPGMQDADLAAAAAEALDRADQELLALLALVREVPNRPLAGA